MTLSERTSHFDRKAKGRHAYHGVFEDPYSWHHDPTSHFDYDLEDELCDQLSRFPDSQEVKELCMVLRVATLRDLSSEIINGGIEYVKGDTDRLHYAKLVNSWIATAEETIAAGRNLKRIADRRKRKP